VVHVTDEDVYCGFMINCNVYNFYSTDNIERMGFNVLSYRDITRTYVVTASIVNYNGSEINMLFESCENKYMMNML
jgi:hypothetical protein